MIPIEKVQRTSMHRLKSKNYNDYKRLLDIYDKWDVAAKSKDFYTTEHYEYMIRKIHDRNGLEET